MSWESQWQIYWHSRCEKKCNNTIFHLNINLLGPNWSTRCPYKTNNRKKLNTTMLPGWQHCKLLQMTLVAYYTLLLNTREVMMKTMKTSHLEGFTPEMSWLYSQPFFSLCNHMWQFKNPCMKPTPLCINLSYKMPWITQYSWVLHSLTVVCGFFCHCKQLRLTNPVCSKWTSSLQ